MRLILTVFCAAGLLGSCASDGTTGGGSVPYMYDDWLYHHYDWYDDDFWIWVDDHPDCCDDEDDIEEALQNWYDDLDPDQQQAVRDRVEIWMGEQGVVPAAGQSSKRSNPRDGIRAMDGADARRASTMARPAALRHRTTPGDGFGVDLTSDQRAALGERAADLSPQQRAALRESAQGTSFDRASGRRAGGGVHRSMSSHPTPSRAGLSGGTRFRAARGGGRGGRGRGR